MQILKLSDQNLCGRFQEFRHPGIQIERYCVCVLCLTIVNSSLIAMNRKISSRVGSAPAKKKGLNGNPTMYKRGTM